jgi:DNA polymerase
VKKRLDKNIVEEVYGVSEILRPPAVPAAVDSELSFAEFREKVLACAKCPLAAGRTNVVFGEGNENADLMFVGEGPGQDEDEQGRPFVGRAGKLLTQMIEAMKYSRSDVYIANIVKCRPPGNRAPFREEAECCIPYLFKQIKFISPKIIVCLGSVATQYLLNTTASISKIRGEFVDMNGILVMPTYHPAYLLRSPTMKKFAWADLQKVMEFFGKK